MTDDVRIVSVVSGSMGGWKVRGERYKGATHCGPFVSHTESREVAAMCLGGKILELTLRLERDESGDIVKASVL